MSGVDRLNLARRPFSNRSPRRRLRIMLWTATGVLVLLNSFLFAQYWISSSSSREELRKVRESSDEQVEVMRALERRLANVDLEVQNEQVRFLNRKIAERTFPWSDLFDDLATVLPRNVRLLTVAPGIEDDTKKRRGKELRTSIDWIGLEVSARAKSSDDVLDLIDAMFEHPSFAGPTLAQETQRDGEIEFNASVRYRVAPPSTPEPRDESTELVIAAEADDDGAGAAPGRETVGDDGPGEAGPGSASRRASVGDGSRSPRQEGTAAGAPASNEPRTSTAPRSGNEDVAPSPEDVAIVGSNRSRPAADRSPEAAAPVPGAPRSGSTSTRDPLPTAAPDSTEAIADERFGRGQPRAPRVVNASGNNGGAR